MRLVCPNCSAQYEIDGSMIPEDGRDVQCSNCGHTWFELPGPSAGETDASSAFDTAADVEDEFDAPPAYDLDDDDSFEVEDDPLPTDRRESVPDFLSREDFEDDGDRGKTFSVWDDEPDVEERKAEQSASDDDTADTSADTLTEDEAATDSPSDDATEAPAEDSDEVDVRASEPSNDDGDGSSTDNEDDDDHSSAAGAALAAAATQRRPADAAALDILREEAERELSQRRAPPSEPLETQSDLGLEDIRHRRTPSRALRARMAHLGEEPPKEELPVEVSEVAPAPKSAPSDDDGYEEPRRDLLPDINEINSTLKSSAARSKDSETVKRSGFRFGFMAVLFLTVAAIFAYAQAPAIARALPQTETTMISYVDWANGLRDRVDGLIGN